SRRRHTRWPRDWSSDVCSSDLLRSYDAIIRWGGDEFLAVLPQTPLDAAEKVMAAVVETFVNQTGRRFTAGFAELQGEDTLADLEIGRASCRERVEVWVGGGGRI